MYRAVQYGDVSGRCHIRVNKPQWEMEASMSRTAPQQGQAAHAERDAFDHALAPCYSELLQAAQREVRHRLALDQFAPDDPTPEQLLDMALKQAWRERRRLSPALGIKALALAAIFRTGQALGAREAARRRRTTELLPEEVEPDPLYQEDEDEFWQSHELDYPRDTEVFSGVVDRARDDAANEDEFVGRLAPREREVLLMHEVHGVALREVALALAILPAEAEQVLASARRRLRAAGKMVNARPELRSRSSSTAGTKTRAETSLQSKAARREMGDTIPALSISPEKVCFIVVKAREFNVKDVLTNEDDASNAADDGMVEVLEDHPDDPVVQELTSFIAAMNEDEQVDLVTLAWLGRGDGDPGDWNELRAEAARAHGRTARYLLGMPLLSDYLEEALAHFNLSCDDFERDRL
jgi:DNA-directed RNA polymerase specialized sigma24 family protein